MTDTPARAAPAIVVATDLSQASRTAFDAAISLAGDFGGRIVLVHALEPTSAYHGLGLTAYTPQAAQYAQIADIEAIRELTEKWAEPARQEGLDVTVVVEAEAPAKLIAAVAQREAAGLMVVGSHGRTGLGRALLGSVAEKVVRHAERPVLVVPTNKENQK